MTTRSRTAALGIAGITCFLIIASTWIHSDEDLPAGTGLLRPLAQVDRGPFEAHIVETARLEARRSVTLSSELPSNRAKVLFLVPEGELVQAGETVARFDTTPFEEDIQKIESEIREEQADLQQAEAEMQLQQADAEDQEAKLRHQIEVARLKLTELRDGDIPIRMARSQKELQRIEADLEAARKARETEDELFRKGLTRRQTFQQAVDREQEIAAEHRIAARNLHTLETVTLPSELKQAQLQLDSRENALEFFTRTRQHKVRQQEAVLSRTRNRLQVLAQELDRARDYLARTTIEAPVTGMVLYKVLSIQNEERKIQVGDSLWNRHAFAVIPDMSSMVAHIEVRESEMGRIAAGQTATVQPRAWPDLQLSGVVESIGTLVSGNRGIDNHFSVRIALQDTDSRLRPGMTGRVSILTAHRELATLIPVEAVFWQNDQAVCFVWNEGEPRRVAVTLGASDGERIVVNHGLEAGQQVMLIYPENFSS